MNTNQNNPLDLMAQMEGLEQSALDALNKAAMDGEGIRLPFATAYTHIINGDARMRGLAAQSPAVYFGGWAMDAEKVANLINSGLVPGLSFPNGWAEFEGNSTEGKTWNGLCSRTIEVSIIASRKHWLSASADGSASSPHYKAGAFTRQHIQVLALLYSDGKPWCPVVLTAKGFQAKFLGDAMKEWNSALNKHKTALNATQFPLGAFRITLGTCGTAPTFVEVGKEVKNKVTPVKAIIPENMTDAYVANLFVGPDVIRANAERLAQADEWLKAWNAPAEPQEVTQDDIPTDPF